MWKWNFFSNIDLKYIDITNVYKYNYTDSNAKQFIQRMHVCIYKVTKSLNNFQYNVAVATLREFSNIFFYKSLNKNNDDINISLKEALTNWVIMISPIMPHLAEDLWKTLGYNSLVANQKWPSANKEYLDNEEINLIIQINGKKKILLSLKKGLSREETEKIALETLKKNFMLKDKNIKKIIVIPDKIVNLVI